MINIIQYALFQIFLGKVAIFMIYTISILILTTYNLSSQEKNTKVPQFLNPTTAATSVRSATVRTIRFLTTDDFPPFNFIGPRGQLDGFNVGLARALCLEIKTRCTMQAVPWSELSNTLRRRQGDAIIAGIATSDETLRQFAFSNVYLRLPARFFARKNAANDEFKGPGDQTIGVEEGSAHEAFLKAFFPDNKRETFADQTALRLAVKEGKVKLGFADGVAVSFWLQSGSARDCCTLVGGPYLNSDFFGPGLSIAVPIDRQDLKEALDDGLASLMRKGKYAEIYLRYFPINFF